MPTPPARARRTTRALAGAAALGALAGAGALVWGAGVEVRRFVLRRVEVPVLAPGQAPLRVLHLSDLHLLPGQHRKRAWLRSLADLAPDLVVDTGDNIASAAAVPALLDDLAPLLERPGAFVLGSNDYHAPRPKNPAAYLLHPSRQPAEPERLPTGRLVAGLSRGGWLDLTNATGELAVAGRAVHLVGTDDPHLQRDRYLDVGGPASPPLPGAGGADGAPRALRLGVTHAPYRRVLDAMTADGLDLLLAGHTHGGQLRVPGLGALVTNCDLPRAMARGLHRWERGRAASWLHVSAGAGTSPYAPVRFACSPEATLLTLVARPA